MLKTIVPLIFVLSIFNPLISEAEERFRIVSEQMSFQYMSHDGSVVLDCSHARIRDLPDWEVVCGKGTPMVKEFVAHFIAREMPQGPQRTSFEVLYWVTERNSSKPVFNSTSFWINLKSKTALHSLVLNQGVENDYAVLTLRFVP